MIRLVDVGVSFSTRARALFVERLELPPGSFVGLIGPPASGKSVLMKAMAALLRPSQGSLFIDDRDLSAAPERDLRVLRRQFGMLFQNNALFDSLTVFENVAFPLRRQIDPPPNDEIERRVRARLSDVSLAAAEDRFPHALSGGMQKRAGIARATIHTPRLRLFDEPTAGLDPVTASRILLLIRDLHATDPHGVTVVVSNEMDSLLRIVPRVTMLHRGRVAFDGTIEALDDHALARSFVRGDRSFEA